MLNLVTACRECNQGKRHRRLATPPPDVDVDQWSDWMSSYEEQLVQSYRWNVERLCDLWEEITGVGQSFDLHVALARLVLEHGYDAIKRAIRVHASYRAYKRPPNCYQSDCCPAFEAKPVILNLREVEWIATRWEHEADSLQEVW